MTSQAFEPPVQAFPFSASPAGREGRDRAFLYLRGLDLPPVIGLELALEALRRTGGDEGAPDVPTIMAELFRLLREKGLHPEQMAEREPRLTSCPPMNRSSMIAEGMDTWLVGRLWRRLVRLFRPAGPGG